MIDLMNENNKKMERAFKSESEKVKSVHARLVNIMEKVMEEFGDCYVVAKRFEYGDGFSPATYAADLAVFFIDENGQAQICVLPVVVTDTTLKIGNHQASTHPQNFLNNIKYLVRKALLETETE